MNVDRANNHYEEVPLEESDENVRVTYVEKAWDGGAGLRFQIRGASGRLRQGPEIPEGKLAAVIAAALQLVIERRSRGSA